jgi:hypothetical protein
MCFYNRFIVGQCLLGRGIHFNNIRYDNGTFHCIFDLSRVSAAVGIV